MREGLVAFTLGELGLLTAFVLTFAIGFERQQPTTPAVPAPDTIPQEKDQRRIETLRDSLETLRDSLADLRSPQLPACQQVGLVDGYLVTTTVVGLNQYMVEGDTLSLSEVQSRFAPQLEEAALRECVHQARALHAGDLPVETFVSAFNRLGQLFYVRADSQP